MKEKQIEHEFQNGLELLGKKIRVTDYIKDKVIKGKTQLLLVDDKIIQFHKDNNTGYWVNTSTGKNIRLHREKLRIELDLTQEQMKRYDVHHIDGNKDNNDIHNLQLINKVKHATIHAKKQVNEKIIKVCEYCGEEYQSSSNVAHKQRFCSNKCKARYRRANGLNNTIRICKNCGKEFICDNTSKKVFCTRSCAGKYNYHKSLK